MLDISSIDRIVAGVILVSLVAFLITRTRWPHIPIWAFMAFTSFLSVVTGLTPIDRLSESINIEVILFLVGMFSIVGVAESSGLLEALSLLLVSRFRSVRVAVVGLSLIFGFLAAIAVNDTVAVMGPAIAVFISKVLRVDPKPLLLLLAFSITIGSTMTPIGNPQNMLIAVESGLKAPFISFLYYLLIPTIINLVITALIIMRLYGIADMCVNVLVVPGERIRNYRDAVVSGLALALTIASLIVNDVLALLGMPHIEHRGFIPFVIAAAMFILVSKPREAIGRVDWGTIVFFITMFITMDGVWRSGLVADLLSLAIPTPVHGLQGFTVITLLSLALSQLLSNVPYVRLALNYMESIGYTGGDEREWITLAMSSTIAGNLTLLGAASNIIILERLESQYGRTISFMEFLKVGSIITVTNIAIYTPFILLL
jgi:Na+/H+ antiporter NhaD/arsenite permease-like protein